MRNWEDNALHEFVLTLARLPALGLTEFTNATSESMTWAATLGQ